MLGEQEKYKWLSEEKLDCEKGNSQKEEETEKDKG